MMRFADIEQTAVWYDFADPAALHYSDDMEYHNWDHACAVAVHAADLAEICIGKGIYLERDVLNVAAAWHDAGYHEDHTALGFASKEQYSAALSAEHLRAEGATEEFIGQVTEAILGTTHKAVRTSLAALVLHRADIADVGGEYKLFAHNNYKLLLEARQRQPDLTFKEWRAGTSGFLDFIIAESLQELPRLEADSAGYHSFPAMARRNRERFMKESDEAVFGRTYSEVA